MDRQWRVEIINVSRAGEYERMIRWTALSSGALGAATLFLRGGGQRGNHSF